MNFSLCMKNCFNKIGKERGWGRITRAHFDDLCEPDGPLLVGSAEEIIAKLKYQYKLFNNTRFLAQIIFGNIANEKILHSIELFAKEVVPAVKSAAIESGKN